MTNNSTYKKLAIRCTVDTFVSNQSLDLRINPDSYRDGEDRPPSQSGKPLAPQKQYTYNIDF